MLGNGSAHLLARKRLQGRGGTREIVSGTLGHWQYHVSGMLTFTLIIILAACTCRGLRGESNEEGENVVEMVRDEKEKEISRARPLWR